MWLRGLQWVWCWDMDVNVWHTNVVPSAGCCKIESGKTCFQGVDAIKWTYTVMPFRPTNGPATFINFIHNIDSIWKEQAQQCGISINEDTNTKIIIDDIVSWADQVHHALAYMQCQLQVCQACNLSLNLHKSYFFQHNLKLLALTCARMVIVQQSLSTVF